MRRDAPVRRAWRQAENFQPEYEKMNAIKMAALALIVAGVLGLIYGGFSYTKDTHEAKLGPIQLSVTEKQTVNIPIWAGVGAIVIGGVLLLVGGKKS
jgi:TRAP-type C4-dicarboxylate transport system permease small subunit